MSKRKRDPKSVSWLDDDGEAVSAPNRTPKSEPAAQLVLNPRKPAHPKDGSPKRAKTPPIERKPTFHPVESHRGKLPLVTARAKALPAEQQAKVGRLLTLAKLWYAGRRMMHHSTLEREEDLL